MLNSSVENRPGRKCLHGFANILFLALICSTCAHAADYDVAILNGRVMDPETGFDGVRNVGIRGGKIAAITTGSISGGRIIDATGHAVTAGFIDSHVHSLDLFSVKLLMRDGVTTGMDLEVGAWPVAPWYEGKKDKWPINYGTTVSQEIVRMSVHDANDGIDFAVPIDATGLSKARTASLKDGIEGWSVTKSSLEQMNEISRRLDQGLREGALGLGSTIGYMRTGVTTYEMFEAQRAAARYGRLTAAHLRFHPMNKTPTESPMGFAEAFTNAVTLKAPLLISHNNDYGWWEIEEKLALAREQGLNVWGEYYPYTAGAGPLGSEFLRPEMWEDTLGYKYEETLFDPVQNKFLTRDEYFEAVATDPGRTIIAHIPPRKPWLRKWLKVPHMVVAGDTMWSTDKDGNPLGWDDPYQDYVGHPRTAGTRGRVLRLAREENIPLMFTLSQLSYWHAKHLGDAGVEAMKIRGRMQEGMVADIVVFDPAGVTDNADFTQGANGDPTTGIPYVIVHGRVVVDNSKVRKVMAGQAIRFPVEEKGRFEPVSKAQYPVD